MPEGFRDIIIIVLVLFVIYLFFDRRREHFDITNDTRQLITNAVNNKYNIDISAMRNMGQVASKIVNNNDSLTIPATLTTMKDLNADNVTIGETLNVTQKTNLQGGLIVKSNLDVQGSINTSDLNIMGNLKIDNTKFNNILPFNTIILWSEDLNLLPPGWAPCTGRKYKYKPNPVGYETKFIEDPDGFQTPYIPAPPWANDTTREKLHYVIRMKTQELV